MARQRAKNVTYQIQILTLKTRTQVLNQLIQVRLQQQQKYYVPRFLIIHSEKEGETISSLSPFVVHKTIMSIAGEPKSIKNLMSSKESHEKSLQQMKTFCGLKCSEHIQGYYSLSSLEQSDKR